MQTLDVTEAMMDAAVISPSGRFARLLGAGLLLAGVCVLLSLVLGADRSHAADDDASTPGLLGRIGAVVADATDPLIDDVAAPVVRDVAAPVVNAVANPVLNAVAAPVVSTVTDAAATVAPILAPASDSPSAPAISEARHPAPAAPAPAPAADAPATDRAGSGAGVTDGITRPLRDLVRDLPLAGTLAQRTGALTLLDALVGAADRLVGVLDTTTDAVVDGLLPIPPQRPAHPATRPASEPASASPTIIAAAGSGASAALGGTTAVNAGQSAQAAPVALAPTADPPDASALATDPPGRWPLSDSGPASWLAGSSTGSAVAVALVAAFLLVAHRAWVRRAGALDDRVPRGPASRTQPSPD